MKLIYALVAYFKAQWNYFSLSGDLRVDEPQAKDAGLE